MGQARRIQRGCNGHGTVRPSRSPILQADGGDFPSRRPQLKLSSEPSIRTMKVKNITTIEASGETKLAGFEEETVAAKHTDEEGRAYYFNKATQESQWEAPADEQEHTAAAAATEADKKEDKAK